jgi:hypothetical protein
MVGNLRVSIRRVPASSSRPVTAHPDHGHLELGTALDLADHPPDVLRRRIGMGNETEMAHGFPRAAMPGIAFDPPPRAKPPARVNLPPPESGSPADPVVSRLAGEGGRRDERCGFPFVRVLRGVG